MKIEPTAVVLVCVISYLTYHAVSGRQGLSRWNELQTEESRIREQRDTRLAQRDDLNDKITRLYEENLDRDYLEEIARTRFHFVYSDEFVLEPPSFSNELPDNEELFDLSIP